MTQRKHPVFSGFLAVVWLAVAVVSVNAANPSFSALVWTNSAGVITPIKSPTNVVRITSGLADNATNAALVVGSQSAWSNEAAALLALRNTTNTVLHVGPFGGIAIGKNTPAVWGSYPGEGNYLLAFKDVSKGDLADWYVALGSTQAGTLVNYADVAFGGSTNVANFYIESATASTQTDWYFTADSTVGAQVLDLQGRVNGTYRVALWPSAPDDGSVPYVWDTSIVKTSGTLEATRNLGTNVFEVYWDGELSTWDLFVAHAKAGATDTPYLFDTDKTHTSGNLAEIANNGANKFTVGFAGSTSIGTSGEGFQFHFVDSTRTASTWFSSLGATANINVQNTGLSFQLTDTSGDQGVSLEPTVSSGSLPFLLRALQTQSSSNIFEVRNDTVQAFGVTSGNGIFIGNLTNQISRDSVNGNALIITNTGAGTGGLWVGTTNIIGELASKGTSGTWTPTLTSVANLAGTTAFQCQYQRVGNVVTFSGKLSADPSLAATSTQIGISLPIASDFSAEENAGGTAFAPAIAGQGAAIKADAINDRLQMQWVSGDITDQPMFFSGSYLVQ